jgi:hemolysin D
MLVFAAGVAWSWLGHMDIVAVAQGKVLPSGRTKVIQPLETGVVAAIHVRDGDRVSRGDPLLELDATAARADEARLATERRDAALRAARLRALLEGEETLAAPEGADPGQVAVEQALLREARAELAARRDSARERVRQRAAAVAVSAARIDHLEALLPLVGERVAALKAMVDEGYGSRVDYLELEEERVDHTQELRVLERQRELDRAALADARKALETVALEARRRWRGELSGLRTRVRALDRELEKARNRRRHQRLLAPIDGTVQQLAVHTVGGVVTPAQTLMVVVPEGEAMEVEAWVENRDVGFVAPGQQAEVKVEAFPFTRYGTLKAQVTGLSRDAVPVEQRGLLYSARVALEEGALRVGGRRVRLSPGMNVTVEVKTGKRRLIEYFLSPVLRGLQESARER